MIRVLLSLSAGLAALASSPASSQSTCTTPSADCVEVGDWNLSVGLGLGERSNPIARGKDIPLVVLPQLSYYGKRFFLENLDLGFTLHEDAANTINLIGSPGYDRVFFVRDDVQNYLVSMSVGTTGVPATPQFEEALSRPRRTTYLTGVEWLFRIGAVATQLDALYEPTGRHKGYEVRGAAAVPLLQSEHSLVLSGGFTWKSKEVVDYYYGIDALPPPDAAFNPFIKLGYSRTLSERVTLNAFVHYERLGDSIAESPIVVDDGVLSMFAGVVLKLF